LQSVLKSEGKPSHSKAQMSVDELNAILRATNNPAMTHTKALAARPEGLFSNFASVTGMLDEAEREGSVPVVCFDSGPYLDPGVGPNWWEYYFQPVSAVSPDSVGAQRASNKDSSRWAGLPWWSGLKRASELVARYIRPQAEILDVLSGSGAQAWRQRELDRASESPDPDFSSRRQSEHW
jgi:hypothetical protein